jgi:PAS domain S-box-containing protein
MADPQAREGATDQMAPETTEATNEIAGERDAGSPVGASDTFTTAEVRAPIGNRRWDSIRVRLAYLVLACVVPVWIAAGFLVYRNYQSKRALTEQRMLETARALTMVVDRELANMQAGLNVLASLDTLVSGDLPAIYRAAQKVKQAHPDSNVVLSLATGKELVNLNLPLGARFPLRDPDITRQVFATGKPFITSVYKGPVTGRLNFSVDAPVFRNGRVVYDLAMILPVDHVAAILSQQHLPPEWIGTIIGNDNVVVARTRFPEQIVGRIATPDLLQHTAKTAEGTAEIFNIEGTSVLDSFSRSAITGWTVAIGVPKAVVMAEIWRWLAWTIAGTALLSLTGIGLALLMARRIAGSIQGLIAPVLALGRGESVAIRHFQLTEFDEAAKSLVKASQLVQQRTVEHERAEARREAEGLKQFSVELGRSEAAARTRATELATIMDAEPTVTLVAHDPECQRMTSNRTGYDLLRLPPGANISKSVPESERSSNYRLLRDGRELSPDELPMQLAAATGREVRDCEYTVAFDDGSSRSIFGNAVPLLDERGRVRGAVGAFIDITERKRAEAVLEEREQHLRTILQTTQEAFYLVDVQGNLLDVNDAYCEMSSYTREELLQMRVQELECVENEQEVAAHAQRIIRQGRDRFESQHRRKDGQIIEVESSITFQDIRGGQFVCFLRDITGRKRAEEQLYKLNRTLQAIRNTQQALLHATDESALLERICGIITRDCGHAMMWIGFAEDDRDKTVRIVASAGFDEGYLESVQLTWADTERGRGTSGTAIRTGKVSIIRDLRSEPNAKPWREELMKRGYGSCLSLPLMDKGKVFGTLTIYSKELDAFSEDEVKLLSELADELAYGIGALRMRVARVQAEEKVRESQELLEVFVAQAPVGLAMFDRNMRYVRASNKWCEDKGLEQDTIQGKSHYDLFPDLPEHWKEAHRCSLAGQCVWNDDDQVTLNGKTITARWKIHPWGDSGCETGGIIIFIEDITAWKRAEARISHLASFPELNPYPIIETDLKGKIAYANPSALRVFPDLIQSGQTHALLRNWPSIVESFKTGNERQTTSEIEINGAVYLQSIYASSAESVG